MGARRSRGAVEADLAFEILAAVVVLPVTSPTSGGELSEFEDHLQAALGTEYRVPKSTNVPNRQVTGVRY